MILNYAEHLLPVVSKDKFKNPLLRYYNFIKFGVQINSNSYTPIEQNTVNRIVCSLPPKYQSSPLLLTLIEDLINVSKLIHNDTFEHILLIYYFCESNCSQLIYWLTLIIIIIYSSCKWEKSIFMYSYIFKYKVSSIYFN